MTHRSKRIKDIEKMFEPEKKYSIKEALAVLAKCPPVKFDQSLDVSLKLGIDPRKSDQNVRGTVSLPHGTGKKLRILVFAKGEKVQEALEAGADYAGYEEFFEKVKDGWTDYDAVLATPEMMREVGKLGKVLGPRGLMPTPKAGTVTNDITKGVQELKGGKIEFKVDRSGVINNAVGKLSFTPEKLVENVQAFITAVLRSKPPGAKGHFLQSVIISSTMGPGLKIDLRVLEAA